MKWLQFLLSAIIVAISGMGISFISNCTLIEISKRQYFAIVSILLNNKVFFSFFFHHGIIYSLQIAKSKRNKFY